MKTEKTNKVKKLKRGRCRVIHIQSIKQSLSWQSAEVTVGLEIDCDEGDIKKTFAKAERIVEERMLPKFKQQGKLLNNLAKGRS